LKYTGYTFGVGSEEWKRCLLANSADCHERYQEASFKSATNIPIIYIKRAVNFVIMSNLLLFTPAAAIIPI